MVSTRKIKPLGNRILVKRSEKPTTQGGILLPDSAQEKPRQGEVVAMGPGKMDDSGQVTPIDLKVGDRVLFGAFAGTDAPGAEEDHIIMSEDDVLAVIE